MSSVIVQHQWADGSITTVEVDVESDYPDALAEARATAVRGLAEVVAGFEGEDE